MRVTPVPIPNTMVKTQAADGTSLESVTPEVSDPTVRRELPKVGPITGVKS